VTGRSDHPALKYWLVMPAAGSGRRFGHPLPKQYAPLCGRTVIEWALAPFLADARCTGVVVAVAAADAYWERVAPRLPGIEVAPGGAARSDSVRSALLALAARARADDWVLVHDAARPCLTAADRDRLLHELGEHELGGLLATPAADTLKRASVDRNVASTLDRTDLWRALTPQMFRYGPLCAALDAAKALCRAPGDEAQAFEWLGEHPALIEGSAANLKVTNLNDLALAEALLAARCNPS
jgi:2-C-methyl-D-erythritol 4-phosphate cytidylyltransferase